MTTHDTTQEAVERLANAMDGKEGFAYIAPPGPKAAATLRAIAAERDALREEALDWRGQVGKLSDLVKALRADNDGQIERVVHIAAGLFPGGFDNNVAAIRTSLEGHQAMTVLRWHSNADPRLRLSGDTIDLHQRRVCDMCHSAAAWLRLSLIGSDLLRAALHHDEAERVLGDMPGPAKGAFPALAAAYAKAELSVLTFLPYAISWTPTNGPCVAMPLILTNGGMRWQSGGRRPAHWVYTNGLKCG